MQQNDYFCVLKIETHFYMKKFTLLAFAMLFLTAGLFAQTEKTTVIINKNDGKEEKITIVERVFNHDLVRNLPGFYLAHLRMREGAFGSEANIPTRPSSFEWGLYSSNTIFCTAGGHFGMSWGFGISNSYNYFSHDKVLRVDADRNAYFQSLREYSSEDGNGPVNDYAHRSFLRYWSLRLPVLMQVQWNIQGTPFAISAGAELEWRFGVRSFARYGGSKHLVTNNLNYNPIGCNALVSLVFDNSIFFFRMGLTDMFTVKDVSDIYQMTFGVGFTFDD
jgi:hypothetical protein